MPVITIVLFGLRLLSWGYCIAAALLLAAAVGAWRLWNIWKEARRTARVVARLALVELDEFYTLLDLSAEQSHFLERHGPMLTIAEIRERAQTGQLRVSGLAAKPVASARWYRHADMLYAVREAMARWTAGERPKGGVFLVRFDIAIGEGYEKGGSEAVKTCLAKVIVRDGTVVTAFPVVREAEGY